MHPRVRPARASASCWRSRAKYGDLLRLLALLAAVRMPEAYADRSSKPSSAPHANVDCMDDSECLKLIQSARRLSDANQLNAALTSYQTAYALHDSPWLLINIGRVQQKLGRPAEAILTYRSYLNSQPDGAEGAPMAREYLRQAEQDLALLRDKERQAAKTQKPIYKKAWFWLAIGGSVIAASAITAGIILGVKAGERAAPPNTASFMF